MTIIYRIEKGAPLTAEELDGNFKDLHKRLEVLEQSQEAHLNWGGHVELHGDQLCFFNASKEVISQITLPLPRLIPRGKWQPRQNYVVYDIVAAGKQTYCCFKSHQSSEQFASDQEVWRLLIDMTELESK